MEETPDATPDAIAAAGTDDDFAREIREAVELEEPEKLPRDRATRFYDRIRSTIQRYVDGKGKVLGKTAEFLLLRICFFS